MRKCIWLASWLLALAAAGCGGRQPLNVESPVVTSKGTPSEDEVFKAIVRATAVTSWLITNRTSGHLVAERTLGNHSAKVNLRYSPQRYSISLAETTMVDRPVSTGGGGIVEAVRTSQPGGAGSAASAPTTVHRTYNLWVQELDKAIRAQLITLGL